MRNKKKYSFTEDYRKRTNHGVTFAISRSPINDPAIEESESLEHRNIPAIDSNIGIKYLQLRWLEEEDRNITLNKKLHRAIMTGFQNFKTNYGTWRKSSKNLFV